MRPIVSAQLIVSLLVNLMISNPAHGKQTLREQKSTYKVENCDCLGFSDDIPTFLSDLPGGSDIQIFGEGKTPDEAQKMAQNMCVETYRNYASVSQVENSTEVTENGCQMFRSTSGGDWESI